MKAANLACEDIMTTNTGNVIYLQANYATKHAPGTAALMSCKFGYVSSFPFLVFCQSNGKWNDKLGECTLTSKACKPQNTAYNVVYMPPETSDRYPSGTFAILHCSVGQVPIGPLSAVCLNGNWTAELGYCQELFVGGISSAVDRRSYVIITQPNGYIQSDSSTQSAMTSDAITVNAEAKQSIMTNATITEAQNETLTEAISDVFYDKYNTISEPNLEETNTTAILSQQFIDNNELIDEPDKMTIVSVLADD
ncbi:T-cell receptor beta chain ANA 11, putative [Brugia malayi]|uniref:T-cell receptor beta chain ANA 11, putative n=1 Tax=Brugia malayi TaxID=6279 RepID=A0A4E9FM93_BRUMA|nr:T-cell receptor beta chain ANA 11, putative [Brugia malayi]VIO98075.1 T-cell receptor beta chain ANA 11, putative [Brugia malayi]